MRNKQPSGGASYQYTTESKKKYISSHTKGLKHTLAAFVY